MSKGVSQFAHIVARLKLGLGDVVEFVDKDGLRISTRRLNIYHIHETDKSDEVEMQIGNESFLVQSTYADALAKWQIPPLDG